MPDQEKSKNLPSLEDSMVEINQLLTKMEQGELTLEQSLSSFEKGVQLIKHCQKILEQAEQKVQILIQSNNQEVLVAYGEENDSRTEHASRE